MILKVILIIFNLKTQGKILLNVKFVQKKTAFYIKETLFYRKTQKTLKVISLFSMRKIEQVQQKIPFFFKVCTTQKKNGSNMHEWSLLHVGSLLYKDSFVQGHFCNFRAYLTPIHTKKSLILNILFLRLKSY